MANPDWYDIWLKTGALPDGRRPFEIAKIEGRIFACFDSTVLERQAKGLAIPWPGDEPADDGYLTPWERI